MLINGASRTSPPTNDEFFQTTFDRSRCEHEPSESGARLCGSFTLDPKFFGKFENLFAKRFSRKILNAN